MKKTLAFLLVLSVLVCLAPATLADPDTLTENGGFETRFYRGQP